MEQIKKEPTTVFSLSISVEANLRTPHYTTLPYITIHLENHPLSNVATHQDKKKPF